MPFDRHRWWEFWHPDKAPGKGRAKPKPTPPGKPSKPVANVDNKKRKRGN